MLTMLRSYVFMTFLVSSVLVMGLFGLPVVLFGRNATRSVIKFWARMNLWALRLIAGVSYRLEGAENLPTGGALIAANHQSMWETIALYALTPRPVMILKKELLQIPVYGWWARPAGSIPVDRRGGAKALRAMTRAAARAIADGEQVIVFPEGTRLKPGETSDFRPGVAGIYLQSASPCVAVAHDSGRFWLHPGHKKSPGEITLRFAAPIEHGLDRKHFMARLKHVIESARPDLDGAELTT